MLAAGGLFFFYGMIDTGEFAAYLLYISMFLSPIKRFVNFFEQLQEGMTGLGRFCEIMDIKPEEEAPDAKVLENPQGHIRFDNVSFSYSGEESANRMVIDNLTLDIPKGKTLALPHTPFAPQGDRYRLAGRVPVQRYGEGEHRIRRL